MKFEFSNEDRDIEVHQFNQQTKEFVNTETIQIKAHSGLPAGGFVGDLPEVPRGHVLILQDGAPVVVEDHRADTIYSKTDGSLVSVNYIGALQADHTADPPGKNDKWENGKWVEDAAKVAVELDKALAEKLIEIDKASKQQIESGFESHALGSVHRYDCRRSLDPVDLSLAIGGRY